MIAKYDHFSNYLWACSGTLMIDEVSASAMSARMPQQQLDKDDMMT